MLPCAWPDCQNGVSAKEFREAELFVGVETPIYTRMEWVAHDGQKYFGWKSSHLSNWFFVDQTFWNEARRRRLVSTDWPHTIYHYTSLEGLRGILENKSIWLSDYSYLNDRRELLHGASLADIAIDKLLQDESALIAHELLERWKQAFSSINRRVCVASFSGDGDSLSQWRAYGKLALGVNPTSLALHVNQSRVQKVEYSESVQQELLALCLRHITSALSDDLRHDDPVRVMSMYQREDYVIELIAFFKDPAFKSEDEYRLAYVDKPEVYGGLGFKAVPKAFRVSGGRLVPYVSSADILRSEPRDFEIEFREVVLGPECDDLFERGLREYLDSTGYESLRIRRSTIPFRG
jgi:hypothetical protein